MWIGAHPKAPSRVVAPPGLGTLDRVIESDPVSLLGNEICDALRQRAPLPVQGPRGGGAPLDPGTPQPGAGPARVGRARTPRGSRSTPRTATTATRTTSRSWCALSRPRSSCSRASGPSTRSRAVSTWWAAPNSEARSPGSRARGAPPRCAALFARLLMLEADERAAVLARAAAEAGRRAADPAWAWVGRLLERYPGDAGILAPLYLNLVVSGPRRRPLPCRRRAPRLPRGHRPRDHGELGQRAAWRPHTEACGRPGAARDARLRAEGPGRAEAGRGRPGRARVPHAGPRVRARARRRRARPAVPAAAGAASRSSSASTARPGHAEGGVRSRSAAGRSVLVPAATATYAVEGEGRVARARVPA